MQSTHSLQSPSTSEDSIFTRSIPEQIDQDNYEIIPLHKCYLTSEAFNTLANTLLSNDPPVIFPRSQINGREVAQLQGPQYEDYSPIGFLPEEWPRVWNGLPVSLEPYLRHGRLNFQSKRIPWFHECEFRGASFRLTIDHNIPRDSLPIFTHGMILSYRDWNSTTHKYIINHCTHKDDLNAYLKIVCYDNERYAYNIQFTRPPLILAVPLAHSQVRTHPNAPSSLPPKSIVKRQSLLRRSTSQLIDHPLQFLKGKRSMLF